MNADVACGIGSHRADAPVEIGESGLAGDRTVNKQGAGYGGAILAMVAAGAYDSVRTACRALQTPRTVYHPDPAIAARYEARYQVFRTLYPALREIYPTFA